MSFPYLIQGKNVVIVIDNQPHTISSNHLNYQRILDAIKVSDWDLIRDIIEPKKQVLNYGQGHIEIQGDTLYWKGTVLANGLTRRLIQMYNEGFPIEPMVKFMENVMQNPSNRAVNELYSFLENNNLPITSDGHFLAYKKIKEDYTDCHSGKVLNKPYALMTEDEKQSLPLKEDTVTVSVENDITVVSMERNFVDDDARNLCSYGLHICSQEYLAHFNGDRMITVKVNPANIVSIPLDYNFSKARVAKYEIISEMECEASQAFTKPVQDDCNNWFYEEEDEDDYLEDDLDEGDWY